MSQANITKSHIVAICICLLGMSYAAAQGTGGSSAFNPAISLILDGKYTHYSSLTPALTGVLAGGESEAVAAGFSLSESELVASANIDDKFYGFVALAANLDDNETELELEEAWVQTLTLPAGLGLKVGKFFSDIGYQNNRHPHTWDFVDAPLPYAALLGTRVADTGVQLRWLAPTALFLEVGAELLRGDGFPAAGGADDGTGASTLFARLGGDLGIAHSWRIGFSVLQGESVARNSLLDGTAVSFDGDTDVGIVDFVWKWARNGNPRDQTVTIVAEYLERSEQGALAGQIDPAVSYDDSQTGFYVAGTYQFRPRWRIGARYDGYATSAGLEAIPGVGPVGADPERLSVMVDWSNSEFSRLRLQLSDYESGAGSTTALYLQYVMSIGSHGAHAF
jgi:hypothetical protein